jgi:hypothetical protein
VFPRHDALDQATRVELLSQRIIQAERAAGLTKLNGSPCHAYSQSMSACQLGDRFREAW